MSMFWEKLTRALLFSLDAERAHELGIAALERGLFPRSRSIPKPEFGPIERFGLKFSNPLGIAAGFDKNGVVVNQLARLGFGFVEVGTVTYEPQLGNPKPRLFRLPEDHALINRLGFNNDGAETIANRLKQIKRSCVVGVNIGKNKNVPNEEAAENYLKCFELIHPVADYVVINVSSPNTASLRELQEADRLEELVTALQNKNRDLGIKPLLVKIAPDVSIGQIEAIVDICLRNTVSGIVATNTTMSRNCLSSANANSSEAGGLSGKPLRVRSNEVISSIFRLSDGRLPVIGVGGIFTASDAFDKITAGASLIQAYTGFVYGGPTFAQRINSELAAILSERGFKTIDEAVGTNTAAFGL